MTTPAHTVVKTITGAEIRDVLLDDGWKLRVGMNFANLPTGR